MNLTLGDNPKVEEKNKRHPRSEFEKFIPELTKLCEPFDTWEAVGSWRREKSDLKTLTLLHLANQDGNKFIKTLRILVLGSKSFTEIL